MKRGLFITLEGGEGCGKTTQARRLAARLRAEGREVVLTREPGGTKFGERIRVLIGSARNEDLSLEAELLLFAAARAQLVREVIRPALAGGAVVICDRFADSTTAYQGFGRGLDMKLVRAVNALAVGDCWPDKTILLDLDVRMGMRRAAKRGTTPDRMGAQKLAFYRRVRAGFLKLAKVEPRRFAVVDAVGMAEEIAEKIWPWVRRAAIHRRLVRLVTRDESRDYKP